MTLAPRDPDRESTYSVLRETSAPSSNQPPGAERGEEQDLSEVRKNPEVDMSSRWFFVFVCVFAAVGSGQRHGADGRGFPRLCADSF